MLEAAAAEVFNAALYPERLFADFRDGLAGWLGVPSECVTPAHGAQALISSIAQVFIGPGTPVVVPNLTYGLYATGVGGGRRERHARPAGRARDRPRRGRRGGHRDGCARGLDLRSEQPDRHAHRAGRLGGLPRPPAGRLHRVADEAYIDFADPALRADRPRDVLAGRAVIVIRSFSKIFGLAGLRLGYAISDPEVARLLDLVQEPFNVNRAALAAGLAGVSDAGFVAHRRAQVARRARAAEQPSSKPPAFACIRRSRTSCSSSSASTTRSCATRSCAAASSSAAGSEFGLPGLRARDRGARGRDAPHGGRDRRRRCVKVT